jgi:hypothetical protein
MVITGTCATVTSSAATLTVNLPPSVTSQPAPVTACEGTTAVFQVTATGAGLTYQWRKNGLNIAGATSAVLTLNGITLSSAGNYDVVITGSCGNITSNAAALTVAVKPQITAQPVDVEICEGSDAAFSVTASGTAISYQWRRNTVNLAGQTAAASTSGVSVAQAGNYDHWFTEHAIP